ncbi:hypothetical protein K2Y11_03235 [bacterium]|nr:hypothetical protein [bacterium]
MSDEHDPPAEWAKLRPLTQDLILSINEDRYPRVATCIDFGLATPRHYEAIYHAYRNGDVTAAALEAALGSGPKLTELVRNAPHNPHRSITFATVWDELEPEFHIRRTESEVRQPAKVYDFARERAKRKRDRDHDPER